ncbi:MAG: enolase [Gaiellales bacterium]|jgi:enolase|nr:enolase [Gaiellales bacterium]
MSGRSVERVLAFEALDSRGTPTVACVISLADGAEACATVPAGASTGRHEAHERRDGGERYDGRGVRGAVAAVNGEIAACLRGLDAADQPAVDAALTALDGTPELGRLGSNAVLAASVGCALAAAASARRPLWEVLAPVSPPLLPRPMVNVLSGGAHADRAVDVQDVLVIPLAATTFRQAIEDAARVRAGAAEELRERGHVTALVADEGGLAAPLESNEEALEIASRGIERSGVDAALALDVAATQLIHGSGYRLAREDRFLDGAALVRELAGWARRFPLVSIEDPLGEDDWDAWHLAGELLPPGIQLLGDDLFATSCERIARGVAEGVANAVLVKPNQAGTLSGARKALELAHREGYATVLSARSGESEDAWLADLAVGWRSGQIKVGSTQRSERTAKWNRLLRIEAERPDAELAPWRPARPRAR